MSAERRLNARRILYSPEYLDMGADNGGVVVNLSESGLGFHAVGPVVPDVEIPVSFSLGPGYRIDVKARIVWVNPQGKMGGAIFGKLSKDSRSLIREWLAKSEVENDLEEGAVIAEGESGTQQRVAEAIASAAATPAAPVAVADNPTEKMAQPGSAATSRHESAAQNGVVLPPPAVEAPPEPSPVTSFPAHEIAPPAAPVNMPLPEQTATAPVPQSHSTAAAAPPAAATTSDATSPSPIAATVEKPKVPASSPVQSNVPPIAASVPFEPKHEKTGGASFSLVPSISAWNKGETSAVQSASAQPKAAAPLFPPRSGENIFARSPSRGESDTGRHRSGSALMIIAVLIAAGAIVAIYARGYRQQIGNAIVHIGNSVAGSSAASATEVRPAPTTTSPAPPPSSNGTGATSPSNVPSATAQAPASSPATSSPANPKPTLPASSATSGSTLAKNGIGSSSGTHQKPQAPGPAKAAANAPKPAGTFNSATSTATTPPYPGQAEYQRAESYLNGRGVEQDPAEAAEWFWRSLEAGNTSAALPLADLYIAGNGVSRSCTQARILLDAAAQKNNQEAIHKLAELPENCQ